ncbi:MAG TPA: PepSY domain-containing protein [Burkholderiales bacterium]|nr:PepSY domain-containing protein [Burkholderiales bacterium]
MRSIRTVLLMSASTSARRFAAWALISFAFSVAAYAADKPCTTEPKAKWMTRSAVQAKVQALGYKVVEIEVENGCYAVEVRDRTGKELDLIIDPISGNILRQEDG